jgi:chitinase
MNVVTQSTLLCTSLFLSSLVHGYECNNLSNWDSSEVYLNGDQVQYNDNAYKANWWTLRNNPERYSGQWQEWTLLGPCQDAPVIENPIAVANGPYRGKIKTPIIFSSSGSTASKGGIAFYNWNFGDGSSSTVANPSHTYYAAGEYEVSLTVTDKNDRTATVNTTATISTDNPDDGDNPGVYGKKVIGYFTEWGIYARKYNVKDIHTSGSANKLTHIMYAFGDVKNGECKVLDSYADYDRAHTAEQSVDGVADTWEQGALRGNFGQLRKLKKMYPHLKVVWSFGGWTKSGGFGQAAANPDHFADSCYSLIFDPRWADVFDGIDIDWEYPNACGLSCDSSGFDGYSKLIKALRNRFGDKLVTSAIGAGEAKIDAADYGGAAQYLDFYMLMTYDFFGAFNPAGPTAPHSALHNFDGIPVPGFYSDNGVQVLRSKGVPADKILLGIGFYGRGWSGVSQATPGGSASGAAKGLYEPGIEDYKKLKNSCPSTGTIAGTAYAHCGNEWWSYDTPSTIKGKMDYVKQQGLGGAFFWELSGDTTNAELINAIESGLQ